MDNEETNKLLGKVEAKLKAYFWFISNSGNTRSVFTEDVTSVRLAESVLPYRKESWRDVSLGIPANTTPTFDNSNCIHLHYFLSVKIDMSLSFDFKVIIPLTISSNPQMTPNHGDPTPFPLGNMMSTEGHVMLAISATGSSAAGSHESGMVNYPPHAHPQPVVTQQPTVPAQIDHLHMG